MRHQVALILALCVLSFFVGGISLALMRLWFGATTSSTPAAVEIGTLWADMVKVLIGGLVGYIAGGRHDRD